MLHQGQYEGQESLEEQNHQGYQEQRVCFSYSFRSFVLGIITGDNNIWLIHGDFHPPQF